MSRIVNGVVISKNPSRGKHEVKDYKGKVFGELTVEEFDHKDKCHKAVWRCICSCGKECLIRSNNLQNGQIISCGHINRQMSAEKIRKVSTTHGASKEPWYNNYSAMRHRVTNPNSIDAKYYTHERIKGKLIEQSWLDDPWEFFKEIGEKPGPNYSIDRINNNLGYIKGNVRWADKHTQTVNRNTDSIHKSKSGYRGITLIPKGRNRRARDCYYARIRVNGKEINLGYYEKLEDAKRARYEAETKFGYPHTFEISDKRPDINIQMILQSNREKSIS